jgi:hypothetical protein
MDSPNRTTPEEQKYNRRQEIRGGKSRDVWDEVDDNGSIVKTAVWVVPVSGPPLQSWDEYEAYLDEQLQKTETLRQEQETRKSPEQRRERHEKALARRHKRSYGRRDELAAVLEYYAEENPTSTMISSYRFHAELIPYFNKLSLPVPTVLQLTILFQKHQKHFEEMGFTFGQGWCIRTRNNCMYIGLNSTEMDEDKKYKDKRNELLAEAIAVITPGEYSYKEIIAEIRKTYKENTDANLRGILMRNYALWGLRLAANERYIK